MGSRWNEDPRHWRVTAFLALIVAVQAAALFHELAVGRYDLNDNVFHAALIEDCADELRSGGNPVDFWAAEWSLGYPVLRTYQPLGHLLVAGLHVVTGIDVENLFGRIRYLLLCLWPLTAFVSARWLGFSPWTAAAAAALAPLVATDGLFGLELGSYVWRGSGLFTQSLAMHLLALTLGFGARVLRSGRGLVAAGLLLGSTFLGHFIYGYMAALSLVLLALVEAPRWPRLRRTIAVAAVSAVTAAPCLVPLLLDAPWINRSRWEAAWKWDSLGAAEVTSKLVHGKLLDAGRFPSLSLLALIGAAAVSWTLWKRNAGDPAADGPAAARFALAGAVLWLALFCGRPTWGDALRLLGLGELTHLHRLIGGFHFFAVLVAAVGLRRLWTSLDGRGRAGRIAAATATVVLLAAAAVERAAYLERNRAWGLENAAAHRAERAPLDAVLALAGEAPGRVFPGLGGGWGKDFKVGSVPLSAWLSRRRIPALAYLYHAMAPTGDLMVHFDEWRPEHYRLFNVSTVLAPSDRRVAPFLEPGARSGRFRLWRAPSSGYFDVVAVDHAAAVDRASFYAVNKRWLDSPWPGQRRHLRLDFGDDGGGLPRIDAAGPLPPAFDAGSLGTVDWESRQGETYRAQVRTTAPSHLLFKMTYHRGWRATVDGEPRPTVSLSPGFVGVALEPDGHHVELRYLPETWRGPLAVASLLVLLAALLVENRPS